jgi:mRNA interferase MazF
MDVGDVYWVEFPPRNGHVQAGRRPAIVAQDASATSHLPTILLIPLTTQLGALRFPGTVLVDAEQEKGLRRTSVALVFQLTVLDHRLLGSRLGRVSGAVLEAVWAALDKLTGRIED